MTLYIDYQQVFLKEALNGFHFCCPWTLPERKSTVAKHFDGSCVTNFGIGEMLQYHFLDWSPGTECATFEACFSCTLQARSGREHAGATKRLVSDMSDKYVVGTNHTISLLVLTLKMLAFLGEAIYKGGI